MTNRLPLRSLSIFVTSILFVAIGCVEDPTAVGVNVLPATDFPLFASDTLAPTGFSIVKGIPASLTFDYAVTNWSAGQLFLGSRGGITASSLIKFNKLPDSLQGIQVTGAEILFSSTSNLGDSTTALSTTMYRAVKVWAGDSLTIDSLTTFPGLYVSTTPLPAGVRTGLSAGTFTLLPLDTAVVRSWFVSTIDSGTANLGVRITTSLAGGIRGYASFNGPVDSVKPKLRIAYVKNGVAGTAILSNGYARSLADMPSTALITDPTKLYVQNGVAYRSSLTFDVSGLPRPLSVNAAQVEITLDAAGSSFGNGTLDSLYIFFVSSDGSLQKVVRSLGSTTTSGGKTRFIFPIYVFGREWVRNNVPPRVIFAGFTEDANFNRFSIYGPSAAPDLRPRLIMTYSRPQLIKGARP